MWLYVFMIAVFVVFVIILIWQTNIVLVDLEIQNQMAYYYYYNELHDDDDDVYDDEENYIYDDDYNDENVVNYLDVFEKHYISSLPIKFLQKAEKIFKPTRQFSDDNNIFVGLEPWLRVADFGTLLHTLIGYGVRFRDVNDALYLDFELAHRLYEAIYILYDYLPVWEDESVHRFGVALFECLQNTCIVLREFYDLSDITESLLYYYLPSKILVRNSDDNHSAAVRMCLPYVYGQLLRGYSFDEIATEYQVRSVIEFLRVSFSLLTKVGSGIHYDYVYFDDTDVRLYDSLIGSYFTFGYYNFLFGPKTVDLNNVHKSIMLMGSNLAMANPALIFFSNLEALAHIMDYPDGVYAADFSKVLTIRNDLYFGSVVGQTVNVAYYKADDYGAAAAAMTRKIWSKNQSSRDFNCGLESGMLIIDSDNNVFSTKSYNSNLYPSIASTAIATTASAGVMIMHARFEELNLEFYSYTLYHRYGMFHLYDRIRSLRNIDDDVRCVVLTRDTRFEPKWMVASANTLHANGVVAKHHNIIVNNNNNIPNFKVKTFDNLNLQSAEQIVGGDLVNAGVGVACFSLLAQEALGKDDTVVESVPETNAFIITANSIRCVVDFPIVILRDDETREITINDATSVSTTIHRLNVDRIRRPLSLMSLSVDNLKLSSDVERDHDDRFVIRNVHGNQFKFSF
ncbi:ODV-E66 [Spodoptera eridania nucleopolyhedrovirus]|uniref:ODV-E66 n=1 Tax=Spodoptera eridania nucleopolyhedrovirus TaxID=2315721 RepID=A0A346TPZ8_9ABAC|nr:ODV-E66 [Spodoptera eridania nucleopolyhedrovirus]AXU41658.1 ODV-E66 [Spodoptera eridania nucleopolyhedrovirus]